MSITSALQDICRIADVVLHLDLPTQLSSSSRQPVPPLIMPSTSPTVSRQPSPSGGARTSSKPRCLNAQNNVAILEVYIGPRVEAVELDTRSSTKEGRAHHVTCQPTVYPIRELCSAE
ncbi:hypothetical protein J1614_006656 [Plenodomus biglobosus]|nr:hypothetical protein J1614_006656 [Plenodomus biglobosus]